MTRPLPSDRARDRRDSAPATAYCLDAQIGYQLRLAQQRHLEIFSRHLPAVTPTQLALLARLLSVAESSQNELGRSVGLDAATTKGVVDRLLTRGLLRTRACPDDRRRLLVSLTGKGRTFIARCLPAALQISEETLAPLNAEEQRLLLGLLSRLTGQCDTDASIQAT